MTNKTVPQIDTSSSSVGDYPTYTLESGEEVRVASPSELGLRQIQMLMRVSNRVQPLMGVMSADEDEEMSDKEFDAAIQAAKHFVKMTSEMTDEQIDSMGELEYVGYITGFLQELTATINTSQRLRFR